MRIYLVGGSVRDAFLGRPRQDRDYVVLQTTEDEFKRCFPRAKRVSRDSPVFLLDGDEYTVSSAADITADLETRDLTVNALARDVATGTLYAHPHAETDLQRRVLRPVCAANFRADPLRVYRAARFAACWPEWRVHSDLLAVMHEVGQAGLLSQPAAERVGGEVRRALQGVRPGRFLSLIVQTGCLGPWFAEWQGAEAIPAGPPAYHSGSVLAHTCRVVDELAGSETAAWMGWCHDMGKAGTPAELWPHHYRHEHRGEAMAWQQGQRLRLPKRLIRAGGIAARWHMLAGRYDALRAGTQLDLVLRLHRAGLVEPFCELARADGSPGLLPRMEADLKRVLAVSLPANKQGQGPASGEYLRQLQIRALRGG